MNPKGLMSTRTTRQRLRREGQAVPRAIESGKPRIDNLVVIGASAGGLQALEAVFDALPSDIPAAIVVVLHQSANSPFRLAATLGRLTQLPVVTVGKDQPLRQGAIHITSPSRSMTFQRGYIQESTVPQRIGARTTIDRMFASAADAYGDRVIGVVLSGLLRDGTDGLRAVHDRGGLTIVQDPDDAEFGEMPRNASRSLAVTFRLALRDIGPALDLLARRSSHLETGGFVTAQLLKRRVDLLMRLRTQSGDNDQARAFLEEELLALRREAKSIAAMLRRISAGRSGGSGT